MGDLFHMPSLALLEANRLLQERQAQARSARQAEEWPVEQGERSSLCEVFPPAQPESAAAIIATLPDHLGWGSACMAGLLRRQWQQKPNPGNGGSGQVGDGGEVAAAFQAQDHSLACLGEGKAVNLYANDLLRAPVPGEWVKLYPDIGLGMLRQDLAGYVLLGDPAARLAVAPKRAYQPATAATASSTTGSSEVTNFFGFPPKS